MKITYWDAVLDLLNYTEISGPVDGPIAKYRFHKNQTAPTEEEIQTKLAELQAAEPMRLLRLERNQLLAQTDWRMNTDYPYTDQTEWASYRTQLRNLPATSEPTLSESGELIVDWPTAPSEA